MTQIDPETLEELKRIHGFEPPIPVNSGILKEELDNRFLARNKNTKNNAR